MQRRSKSNKLLCLHISGNSFVYLSFLCGPRHSVYAVGKRRKLSEFGDFSDVHTPAVCQQYIAKQQKFLGKSVAFEVQYTNFIAFLRSRFCITFV